MRFLKLLFRILFSLNRIAVALESIAGITEPAKPKKEDFKGYNRTEENIIEEEDARISASITNRLISLKDRDRNFFVEDDISDILEEINET